MTTGADEQLLVRLQDVEARVRLAVEHRRADDPAPDDPFRGLYINDESVERLLAGVEPFPDFGDGRPLVDDRGPLMTLARNASLSAFELRLLVTALVPDLDSRFEKLYGYLNDDVTRRRASIGLALELAGASTTSAAARRALSPSGPLVDLGLVLVEEPERPFLTRSLRVPDRVIAHLLGDTAPEPSSELVLLDVEGYPNPLSDRLARALEGGAGVVHVREREAGTAAATAVAALEDAGRGAVVVDLAALIRGTEPHEQVLVCAREALLRDAGLVAGPVEDLAEHQMDSVQRLSRWPSPCCSSGPRPGTHAGRPHRRWSSRRRCSAPGNGSPCCTPISPESARTSPPTRSGRTCPSARLRCNVPCTPRRPLPSWTAGGSPTPTSAPASGRRTPPGWSGWPAGSSPRSPGTTWCWRPPYDGRWRSSPRGPGTATRCSWTGGCARAAAEAAA